MHRGMPSRTSTETAGSGRNARATWLLSVLVLLTLLLILVLAAKPSSAAPAALPGLSVTIAPEEEEAGEEWEDWEEDEWEWEEEEEPEPSPAEECPLRSAKASAVTKHQRLKLTVGYTTYEPVNPTREGRQGAARSGTFKRHLGRSGVLRFTRDLGQKRPKGIAIRIRLSRGGEGRPPRRAGVFPPRP